MKSFGGHSINTIENNSFKGFTNTGCSFFPCHSSVKHLKKGGTKEEVLDFNCLFC